MKTSHVIQHSLRLWLKFSNADAFEQASRQPVIAQQEKLLEIIRRNRDTEYGTEHRFAKICSVEDFQSSVPINTYETLTPYIERTLRGIPNVLTADKPLMFATTSGTTGRAKYIPVTPSYLHEYSHGVHVHTYRMLADYDNVFEGKALVSASSDVEGYTESGLPYGAISGYLTRTQPSFIRRFYALPYEICTIKQVDLKYYLMLRAALTEDVRLLIMPNPSSLLLLAQKMASYAEELIHDIRMGSVNPPFPLEHPAPRLAGLHSDPGRAAELTAILNERGRLLPSDVWPRLTLISCWKGGTMPLYLRRLPEFFGNCPVRDLGYMATEGRGATPLVNSGAGGVLNVSSHFFEFLPEEERDTPNPNFLTCDQLESNRQYYIYFTTSAGLYRYDINDLIRVVDFYRHTPVIQFVRKGQGITSITGEKLTESQVTDALMEVIDEHGFDIRHFTARVEWGEPPCYAMYAEMGDSVTRSDRQRFLLEMDRALCAQNVEYEAKRESQRLGPPILRRVAPGSYVALRQKRVAEGAPEAQVKIPQLSTDMKFGTRMEVLEEIRIEREGMGP
ncbi:GH3 auxin-responsive promoter family protein [Nitrolancea hollandica]|uniref:Putative GH3 auxin-responsive promoter family protein n=1 Tax=Nitrolancea hollandica Lb TaxID=1129897 RepID=I4EME3_9BACT|nr:GH3 auxin-responsive promoter family protein [Nitrolancea hollandica]CCF85856.1 putative GH3 auxin-responsive promoter family protein [Nitrolancea hollandica Lb]